MKQRVSSHCSLSKVAKSCKLYLKRHGALQKRDLKLLETHNSHVHLQELLEKNEWTLYRRYFS